MNPINTRRWPRYHVHLPVFIAANPGATKVVVPGMVCELSRAGMELYGGVNLQPGELIYLSVVRDGERVQLTMPVPANILQATN